VTIEGIDAHLDLLDLNAAALDISFSKVSIRGYQSTTTDVCAFAIHSQSTDVRVSAMYDGQDHARVLRVVMPNTVLQLELGLTTDKTILRVENHEAMSIEAVPRHLLKLYELYVLAEDSILDYTDGASARKVKEMGITATFTQLDVRLKEETLDGHLLLQFERMLAEHMIISSDSKKMQAITLACEKLSGSIQQDDALLRSAYTVIEHLHVSEID
jgi:hypothetical protein